MSPDGKSAGQAGTRIESTSGPGFIGVGAQKAGTSWLYANLNDHPEIDMPIKEIHFFSRAERYSRGRGWYESIFAGCRPGAVHGEFSTSYLADPDACVRIAEWYPHAQVIISLRDPVERAVSNYRNDVMAGAVSRSASFREAAACHPEYLEQSRYTAQVQRVFETFGRGRTFVAVHEESVSDPGRCFQELYDFLGVDPEYTPAFLGTGVNRAHTPRSIAMERAIRAGASLARRTLPSRFAWSLKRRGLSNWMYALNSRPSGPPRVSSEDREWLLEQLAPDAAELPAVLGRTPRGWSTCS